MIWVRTSSKRSSAVRPTRRLDAASLATSPLGWLREQPTPRRLTGIDGPWHLVTSEETAALHQFHWSVACPTRTSRRWVAHSDEHGQEWIEALRRQPSLLSVTVEGLLEGDDGAPCAEGGALASYDVLERARWTTDPAPLGLDLQLLTMDLATATVRVTFVNCFVDPEGLADAHRMFVERLCLDHAA